LHALKFSVPLIQFLVQTTHSVFVQIAHSASNFAQFVMIVLVAVVDIFVNFFVKTGRKQAVIHIMKIKLIVTSISENALNFLLKSNIKPHPRTPK